MATIKYKRHYFKNNELRWIYFIRNYGKKKKEASIYSYNQNLIEQKEVKGQRRTHPLKRNKVKRKTTPVMQKSAENDMMASRKA